MSLKGSNNISLNTASMLYAMQLWANATFERAPKVTAVKYDAEQNAFVVTLTDNEEPAA